MISQRRSTFGIVGGIGPLAGADLFFKFVKSTPAVKDSEHFNVILEQQPLRFNNSYAGENYESGARKLHIFNVIQRLIERNADCIILGCFISHIFIDELSKEIKIPIINMMEGLQNYVKNKPKVIRKIGVLTSSYVKKKRLFEKYFSEERYQLVYPDSDVQERFLMEAVYGPKGIKAGHLTGRVIEYLEKACDDLIAKGAEIIIPGFTEIPVVYEALKKQKRLCIIDSNQIYADWALHSYTKPFLKLQHKIGIIGGLGPSATVDLMDKIIKNTSADKDQEHFKMIVEHNPQIPDRTACLLKDEEDPTIPLYTCAKKLEQREASFIAIPCNTAHAFIDRIQRHLTIPIVNMIEEVADYIQINYSQTKIAGLLATSGTIKTRIYHRVFENSGIQLVAPDKVHQKLVMESIYGDKGVKAGFTQADSRKRLLKAAGFLIEQGAQVLILGCTELPLLMEENDQFIIAEKEVAILDPTNILAKKCVRIIANLSK